MTAYKLKEVTPLVLTSTKEEEEYSSIPICIDDILTICKEFNTLGWQIQNQVESIIENGIEESIKSGSLKKSSLPQIKQFLKAITNNAYFGDAVDQANDCLNLISLFEDKNKVTYLSILN